MCLKEAAMQAITPVALEALLKSGEAVVLDIRDENEFNSGHIPGALMLPAAHIDSTLKQTLAGKQPVFYCSSGMRTKNAAQKIQDSGIAGWKYLSGGLEAWSKHGLPTVGGNVRKPAMSIQRQVQITIAVMLLVFGGLALGGAAWPIYMVLGIGLGLLFAGVTGSCALASVIMMMPWNR